MEAAKVVFVRKGYDGTRMQDIAAEAGINKALLHYYYRSKDKLFAAVFLDAFNKFLPRVKEALLDSELPFEKKIEVFCQSYISLLIENPHLPVFILHELQRNPGNIVNMLKSHVADPKQLFHLMERATEDHHGPPLKPEHLIVNLVAMCIFPIAARPILQGFLFGNDPEKFSRFLEERKSEIPKFFMNAIESK